MRNWRRLRDTCQQGACVYQRVVDIHIACVLMVNHTGVSDLLVAYQSPTLRGSIAMRRICPPPASSARAQSIGRARDRGPARRVACAASPLSLCHQTGAFCSRKPARVRVCPAVLVVHSPFTLRSYDACRCNHSCHILLGDVATKTSSLLGYKDTGAGLRQ